MARGEETPTRDAVRAEAEPGTERWGDQTQQLRIKRLFDDNYHAGKLDDPGERALLLREVVLEYVRLLPAAIPALLAHDVMIDAALETRALTALLEHDPELTALLRDAIGRRPDVVDAHGCMLLRALPGVARAAADALMPGADAPALTTALALAGARAPVVLDEVLRLFRAHRLEEACWCDHALARLSPLDEASRARLIDTLEDDLSLDSLIPATLYLNNITPDPAWPPTVEEAFASWVSALELLAWPLGEPAQELLCWGVELALQLAAEHPAPAVAREELRQQLQVSVGAGAHSSPQRQTLRNYHTRLADIPTRHNPR